LRKIVEFIHAHIDQPISLRQLASLASLSDSHFHREFKRSTGLTPGKYISEVRIKRAETLLSETDLPLVQIALQVGFHDQSHFTVAFRRATSMTPRIYRNATANVRRPQAEFALARPAMIDEQGNRSIASARGKCNGRLPNDMGARALDIALSR
jgi:AraC-like DNA-binding protein